ncbi:hypothetical protein RO3G_15058 [Rhizopus delemar RA 99-880]|uniref:FZ domain-containing protein n=1 Tax=Rhizopus delemar (strain RA 99-880 / ATCC MYA-4621 / FGSC 9543 / NRRL 43880) TaxID=246409 RepID=I1CPG7_RHIO9|nr:hypothetical protein RO3G_15058 [Rhizopus delemar RA 99-880]|eukprot:EIE90347.1 hypothetical protein RO3G_15058 [Rhizopus delemar RA 99-880]
MAFNNIHKVMLVLMTCFSLVFGQTYTVNNTQSTSSRFVNNGVNNINASDTNALCTSYPTVGICSKYIDYSIYVNGTSIPLLEQQLTHLVNISHGFNQIAPTCVDAYYRYACSFTYPKCDNNGRSHKANRF